MKSSIDNSVNIGGRQEITGYKTFSNANPYDQLAVQMEHIDQNITPSTNMYGGLTFTDAQAKRVGKIEIAQTNVGDISTGLSISREVNGVTKYAKLSIGMSPAGTPFCQALEPNYSGLIGLGMTFSNPKVMPADGILYLNIKVGSQSNALVTIYDGSAHGIAKFGHNGGSAEYNLQCFTMIVRRGQSVNVSWNQAGTASIDSSYLAAWSY